MNSLVSVLIPVYNREDLVVETLESALSQTYENIEIIVVDNCSTDGTWEILCEFQKKDKRVKIFKNDYNVGPVLNWKRCIDEASGIYAKILFSDDLISNNYISETLKVFDAETAFILAPITLFSNLHQITKNRYEKKDNFSTSEYIEDIIYKENYDFPVSPGAAIFRLNDLKRALVIEIDNSFDLNFKKFGAGNDLLIFLNIAINYNKIKVQKNAMAYFRSHQQSFTISNNLIDYYDFSKYYFLLKFNLFDKLPHFKTNVYLKAKLHGHRKILKLLKNVKIKITLLIELFLQRVFRKLNFYN